MMDFVEFKDYIHALILSRRFQYLMAAPAFEDSEVSEYLHARGITEDMFSNTDTEVYAFEGIIQYKEKSFPIKKSIIIPLIVDGELKGIWLREMRDKRFLILLIEESNQKFWISGKIAPDKPIYVCESIFDALSLSKILNTTNVCASLGAVFHIDYIKKLGYNNEIILAYDNDKAGYRGVIEALNKHPSLQSIVTDITCKDWNELLLNNTELIHFSENFRVLGGIQAKVALRSKM